MKKIITIFMIAFLLISLSACSKKNEDINSTPDKNVEENLSEEQTFPEKETNDEVATDTDIIDTENTPTELIETQAAEIKSDTGKFVGYIDSASIEIELNSTNPGAFAITEEIRPSIDTLNTGDVVKFNYYFDKELQRNLIIDIIKD